LSILLTDLRQRFKAQIALDGVSLHVRSGDCYGFIGHNGSGKTTALRIALGLLRADGGRVMIDGHDAVREARVRKWVGGLIERPGFHDGRPGHENLRMLAAVQGIPKGQVAGEVERVLALVGLADAGDKKVGQYSQGMRQRLGLAQALLGQPRYLLLDEPTNGLDPEGIHELRELMQRLVAEEGVTILLSSHLLHEISDLCTRIGVLRRGQLLVEAPTAELMASTERTYRIRTDDDVQAADLLKARGLGGTPERDGGIRVDLRDHDPAELLRGLMDGGRDVSVFAPIGTSLEEIYLEYSHGERTAEPSPAGAAGGESAPSTLPVLSHPILRVVRYEFQRLLRPATLLAVCTPAILAPFVVVQRSFAVQGDLARVAGGKLATATGATAFEVLGRALEGCVPLLALILAGLASQSMAGELAAGTLRNLLLRPLHRFEIVLGKLAALLAVAIASYLLLLAVAASSAGLALDYGDLVEVLTTGAGTFPLLSADEVWPKFWPAIASPLLPLIGFMTIGFLCGSVVRVAAGALALSLAAIVGLDLFRAFARSTFLEPLLPSTYVSSPLATDSHLQYFVDFASGVSRGPFDYHGTEILVPAIWLLTCSATAMLIFRRKYVP